MEWSDFVRAWSARWSHAAALPGLDAQRRLAPPGRASQMRDVPRPEHAQKHAAVLVAVFPQNGVLHTVMIERPTYDGVHSGQMAFPGGGREAQDAQWSDVALREAEEELGIPAHVPLLVGPLTPLFIPPSGYFVQPILAALPKPLEWKPDVREVARVHCIPLHALDCLTADIPAVGTVPAWCGSHPPIWGASAMILAEVLALPELRTFASPI